MSRTLPYVLRATICKEIDLWRSEGLISNETAALLTARYPHTSARHQLVTVLTILGSILIGLGTILFFGSNWQTIAPVGKVALILSAIVGTHFLGWRFRFEPGERPKVGSALILLACLFFGAGIWLVSQVFNFDLTIADGLLLWATGTMATAFATRLPSTGILASLLTAAWPFALLEHMPGDSYLRFPAMALALFSSLLVSYAVRSRVALWFSIAGATLWVLIVSDTGFPGFLAWATALLSMYIYHRERNTIFSGPYMYSGLICMLGGLLAATGNVKFDSPIHAGNLAGILIMCIGPIVAAISANAKFQREIFGCVAISVLAAIVNLTPAGTLHVSLENLIFLSAVVAIAAAGIRTLKSVGMVNTGLVFFCLYILFRYFDVFFSMMDRALFFIIGGVVLLAIGSMAERSRKTLIRTLGTS